VICSDGGGGKEMVQNSGRRSFQRCGAVTDMARLENMRWEVMLNESGLGEILVKAIGLADDQVDNGSLY